MMCHRLNQEIVREMFEYSEGKLYRKTKTPGGRGLGELAGSLQKDGYYSVKIKYKAYRVHRIIWLYHYGYMPKQIDHIDHDRTNNRIDNLREVTRQDNQRNMSVSKNTNSGVSGVYWHKKRKRWIARLWLDGKQLHLGTFNDVGEAISMRLTANDHYGYHSNHGIAT